MKRVVSLVGVVSSGYGVARERIQSNSSQLKALTGELLLNGSLNVVLAVPAQFVVANALLLGNKSMIWRASIGDLPVWLYRWRSAPLHVVEILGSTHLRETLHLRDGDEVAIYVSENDLQKISFFAKAGWVIFWLGRRHWYYKYRRYSWQAESWSRLFGANQSGTFASLVKAKLKSNEMLSRVRNLVSRIAERENSYDFQRLPLDAGLAAKLRVRRQVENLLNYTKTSGSSYSARAFPAGYHSIELDGELLRGQRDPAARLAKVPICFEGKSVLDIGCNQGGMLFQVDQKIRWGVGIDYDHRMVNVANRLSGIRGDRRLSFYVFNLEREPLDLISDFLPEAKVDVVFLLSICMWLKNWREVLEFAVRISSSMLFETNGSLHQQAEQHAELARHYSAITQLTEASEDDPGQRNRRLYYCERGTR